MGRFNFAAQRVHQHATQLLDRGRLAVPPPWYDVVGSTPPASRLTRPPMQRPQPKGRRPASGMFQPLPLRYEEDELRWEYFNDHPWELARPRVILESDGRDMEKWRWDLELDFALRRPRGSVGDSRANDPDAQGRTPKWWDKVMATQASRPINGESVVQRQHWLMANDGLTQTAAYDKARKEYYRIRHYREIEQRVAREEAMAVGATFGPGPLEIGMMLEDKSYEDWKVWAIRMAEERNRAIQAGSGASDVEEVDEDELTASSSPEAGAEVGDSKRESSQGQTALGDAALRI